MRVTNAPASRERRRRRLKLAKGFYGARSKLFRTATEAVDRAMRLSTEHRKLKKRDFRQLWIARINAASRAEGISYSKLMAGHIDLWRIAVTSFHSPCSAYPGGYKDLLSNSPLQKQSPPVSHQQAYKVSFHSSSFFSDTPFADQAYVIL